MSPYKQSRMKRVESLRGVSFLVMMVGALSWMGAHAQSDDFSDGGDSEWLRYDPFEMAGVGALVTFETTGGTYRLACPPSPSPGTIGPARGASFRPDQYTDFCVSVDVPIYDGELEQAFGILARVLDNPAPGAVFGYAMTYHPFDDDIQITRLDNEFIVEISPFIFLSEPPASGVLRLVFMGQGTRLVGRAYDAANPVVPLAETVINDAVYPSGMCGIAVIDNTEAGDQAADATFDNYYAGLGGAPQLRMNRGSGGDLVLSWDFPFFAHELVASPDLQLWEADPFPGQVPTASGGSLTFTLASPPTGGRRFFGLQRRPLP